MEAWHDFFVAQVGASAALAGLLFVGVSINLAKILASPSLPSRFLKALVLLAAVLVESSLALLPGQSFTLSGAEFTVAGAVTWLAVGGLQRTVLGQLDRRYRRSYLAHIVLDELAVGPLVLAGPAVMQRGGDGLYWVAPGVIFCYIAAIIEAWVLLIEINR